MFRLLVALIATLALAFPAVASASPDWTGSFVPPAQEDSSGSHGAPVATAGTSESVPGSEDEFPWMWLAIGSSAVALGLAGAEIARMRRSTHRHLTSG